jgi:transposase-like protein
MSKTESATGRKWRRIVDEQRSSGLGAAAFCRRHGISAVSLYAWRRRLAQAAGAGVFVEAKVVDPSPAESAGAIEVCLRGGRRLRVGGGFDARVLSELVRVLEGLPSTLEGLS